MTTEETIKLAQSKGWKLWGKPRPSRNGSIYQCLRQGNLYIWIGSTFIEHTTYPHAVSYVYDPRWEVVAMLDEHT